MKIIGRKSGFSIVELLIVLIVLGVMGWLGYMFLVNRNLGANNNQSAVTDVADAPEVQTADDLDDAQTVLDNTDLDQADDTSLLSAELSKF